LFIKIPAHLEQTNLSVRIGELLCRYPGSVKVYFYLAGSRKTILAAEKYWVTPNEVLRRELEKLLDASSVVLQ